MFKRFVMFLAVICASVALVYQPCAAKEDTAQIKLRKTAITTNKLYTYTVKEGEDISTIIRRIPGVREKDISKNYQLIKELNPDIPDLENLEAGQLLVIPGKPEIASEEKIVEQTRPTAKTESKITPPPAPKAPPKQYTEPVKPKPVKAYIAAEKPVPTKKKIYKIKRGDTLYKIIRRELKVSEIEIPQNVKFIKSINPHIRNVNRIYTGTVIKLPGKTVFVKTPDQFETSTRVMASTPEKSSQLEKIIEVKDRKVMPPEARLAVLKQVIGQMNGTIATTGSYYLPIPKAGQVTIDCAQIPVVEFDDNTTVFIDLDNRAHANLKKMIGDNWTNYSLVKVNKEDDVISILNKVINGTKNYNMTKSEKPLTVGALPPVEVAVDWIISKSGSPQPIQTIRSIDENNLLLPKSIKNYYQKNGLIINEISEESGLVGKPEELYSLPPIPVFPRESAQEFSYALVTALGFAAERDIDIQLFDTVKDGFNLSIKADVLVTKGDKKYVIYSQALSPQFINALKQAGNETIFVSDSDEPKANMESILKGLQVPFAYGPYTFSGLAKNQSPYTLKFDSTRINQDLYVVDFDIDPELRGLLKEVWSVNIARY